MARKHVPENLRVIERVIQVSQHSAHPRNLRPRVCTGEISRDPRVLGGGRGRQECVAILKVFIGRHRGHASGGSDTAHCDAVNTFRTFHEFERDGEEFLPGRLLSLLGHGLAVSTFASIVSSVYSVHHMKLNLKRTARWVCISLLIYGAIIAGLIAFGTAKPPAVAPAITKPFAEIDIQALPELLRYKARDGALLSYREYRASNTRVAVLLHGSAGSGVDMHPLALALQRAGITALVPDLRGHGANRPHGDLTYVGQLDDDLADLINIKKPEFLDSTWTILGFSSGAAFALRFAAESPAGQLVDRYVLVSPYLRYDAPSVRHSEPGSAAPQSWASPSVGRIIGLTMLNQWGVHIWDGLPVLAFPVPANIDATTNTYSWRMYKNLGADDDYLADIRRTVRPMRAFVGGSDELLDAEKLKTELQSQRSNVPVSIIPGLGHSDMVTRPNAILAVVAALN